MAEQDEIDQQRFDRFKGDFEITDNTGRQVDMSKEPVGETNTSGVITGTNSLVTNQSPLGYPGLVKLSSGVVSCTPLSRAAMKGVATRYQEDLLQQLVEDNPALLPVKDFLPSTLSLFSLGREIAVDVGGQMGYIDNLLVTNEGRLVLVETKLWRNPESTRDVVAQILQYGMALSALSLQELETAVKCKAGQTISELVASRPGGEALVDDFEEAFERHLRRCEMLYLVVSDGIRVSVERITQWLNDGGSAPFKFGLVELRFFEAGGGDMLVVPRTLLKTREVSRHVVVVDVQGPAASSATAVVHDDLKSSMGAHALTQRRVKQVELPMTRERLISEVRLAKGSAEAETLERIVQHLDLLNLDNRSTATLFQYGIMSPTDEGVFLQLISLGVTGAWSRPSQKLIDFIGDSEFVNHKHRLRDIAEFYREKEAPDPTKKSNELIVGYGKLDGKELFLAQALSATLTQAKESFLI